MTHVPQGSLALTLGYIPPSLRYWTAAFPSLVRARKRACAIAQQDACERLSPERGDGVKPGAQRSKPWGAYAPTPEPPKGAPEVPAMRADARISNRT